MHFHAGIFYILARTQKDRQTNKIMRNLMFCFQYFFSLIQPYYENLFVISYFKGI